VNKSAILYGPKDIRIEDRTIPVLQPDEVLVKSTDVSICATEVKYWYYGIPNVPEGIKVIQGHELGGIIEDTGKAVGMDIAISTRVAVDPSLWCGVCDMCKAGMSNLCRNLQFMSLPPVDGGFQQFYKVPLKNVHPVPLDMPSDWTSMVEPVSVILNALSDAKRVSGSIDGKVVAIVGAGSLGLILVQALPLLNKPSTVCIIDPLDYRLELAKKLGTVMVVNPKTDNPLEKLMDATKGMGADLVFEVSGEPDAYQIASTLSKPGGTIIIVGIPVDQNYIPIQCIIARRSGLTLKFVRRFNPKDFPKAIELITSGKINVADLISHIFPMDKINQAFEMLHQYSDKVIKVVIHPHCERNTPKSRKYKHEPKEKS
jgi:L-iditol 2-dehydrogenase